ncbi:MAG: electron transport complex subunit RsxC [Candidatus Aminicenantes bacterium]|nr:electron transport complex subunit RsxC [Candidatus Aminicenantes bacterium]
MKVKTFPHGVHPPELKESTEEKAIHSMPPPDKVTIPLLQHFGSPAESLVQKGDEVYLSQKIGEGQTLFSASVHSSVSGKVLSVDMFSHPAGYPVPAVTIKNDGHDRISTEREKAKDPFSLSPEKIRQKVKEAGVVGLGGAAFPTAVKLSPPNDKPIDTIIINGCECEPLLTSDYRLMLEASDEILKGAELARIATGAERIIVGIEDNKKKAFEIFQEKIRDYPGEAVLLKTKYPEGAEKNLIYALLRREVPRGGLPFDVGIVVQNVGTAKAIWDAVHDGKPLYERVITVSGQSIKEPNNLLVRIGTSFESVIEFCGGLSEDADILVMGGPMMGIAQWSLDVPVIKGTSGILAWPAPPQRLEYSCIHCGRCIEHCSMVLVPTRLAKHVKYNNLTEAENWGILDCVECGCCQYICPSNIPLVHWIRLGKNKIISLKRKKNSL